MALVSEIMKIVVVLELMLAWDDRVKKVFEWKRELYEGWRVRRWLPAEALQGNRSTECTLNLASQVKEGGEPSITVTRLQREAQDGFGLREQICGKLPLGHKLRPDQPQLGRLAKAV